MSAFMCLRNEEPLLLLLAHGCGLTHVPLHVTMYPLCLVPIDEQLRAHLMQHVGFVWLLQLQAFAAAPAQPRVLGTQRTHQPPHAAGLLLDFATGGGCGVH